MLSLVADENFSHRVLRGVKRRIKSLDMLVAQKVGISGVNDPALLAWAAEQQRIVLTHDRQTLPKHAYERVRAGLRMPGVIVVSDTLPVGVAINLVTLYIECGRAEDFENQVVFLP